MNPKLKSLLTFLMRIAVSVLLLIFVFSKIDTTETIATLRTADLKWIGLSFFLFFFINLMLLVRWMILIRALGLEVRPFQVTRAFFIGLFGNPFLPSAMGGDLFKIVLLCRGSDQKSAVVASALLDRLSGFSSIAIVAIGSFALGFPLIENRMLAIPIVVMLAVCLMVGAVLFNEKIYAFGCRAFNVFPKLKEALMAMHYDIMLLKNRKRQALAAVGLACFSQSLLAVSFYLIALGLDQSIGLIYFLIFIPMICVTASFPSLGGLGVREAGAAYLFTMIGVSSGIAVSLTLINYLFVILIALIGGVFYVFTVSRGRLQRDPSDGPAVGIES